MAASQMSVQDALWLTMDRPNNLMVVDGAMVLRRRLELATVQDVLLAVADRHPVFRRRAQRRGADWWWVDDRTFDIGRHVVEAELEGPADVAFLQRFVAEQRSRPLHRDRPLWVAYLLPDLVLPDGTAGCAVVMRFHHAIADGVRVTQLMLSTCEVPDGTVVPTVVRRGAGDGPLDPVTAVASGAQSAARVSIGLARALAGRAVGLAVTAAGAVGEVANAPSLPDAALGTMASAVRAGLDLVGEGLDLVRHPDRALDAVELLGASDHRLLNDVSAVTKLVLTDSGRTVWSGTPGRRKAVTWSAPLPLDEIKAVGRAHGATVNDVLLAAVSGGLHRYLAEHGAALDEVVWMVPVNLKPFEENLPAELGNFFALVMLPMPLGEATYEQRLTAMHQRMARIKHSDEAVITFGLQRGVSMSPPTVAYALTNFFANKAVGVLTNVPGPTGQLTFGGAPVEQIVGFAPCSGDQPMTATIFSYNGGVTVGFAVDATLIPDPDLLAGLVVDELHAMRAAVRTG